MAKRIGVAVIGGTGYGAAELLRLLALHPEAEIVSVVSRSQGGKAISSQHPHLRGFFDFNFEQEFDHRALQAYEHKVVFTALPHGVASDTITKLYGTLSENDIKLIDFSGDFRLQDPAQRSCHYPDSKAGEKVYASFVYGVPEINREKIASAQFVSNPGCYALTCILAAAPLAATSSSCIIAFDGKSGSSGAGRSPQEAFHHPQSHANAWAYKILKHRHEPEIAQGLGDAQGERIRISFVPHVIPTARGIYATAHIRAEGFNESASELFSRYSEFYKNSKFVRVSTGAPELNNVIGSNFCDLAVFENGDTIVALAVSDNLIKGMSGTAIQNMNLMCAIDETTGLWLPGLGIV